MAIRQNTLASVKKVFSLYPDKMLTIGEISHRSQLSYTTVKRTLHEMGARYVPGVYPQRWTLKEIEGTLQYEVMKPIRPTGDAVRIREPKMNDSIVEVPAMASAVKFWNAGRDKFIEDMQGISISRSSNVDELIDVFSLAAKSMASVALGLMEVSASPDWYGKLFDQDVDTDLAP